MTYDLSKKLRTHFSMQKNKRPYYRWDTDIIENLGNELEHSALAKKSRKAISETQGRDKSYVNYYL